MVIRSADKSRSEEEAAPRASSALQQETILNDWTLQSGTKNHRFRKKHNAIWAIEKREKIEGHNRKRKDKRTVT
jgi:hypothetical protein